MSAVRECLPGVGMVTAPDDSAAPAPVAWLHLGAVQTRLVWAASAGTTGLALCGTVRMPLGLQTTARAFLQAVPRRPVQPTPLALERAIAHLEDVIHAAQPQLRRYLRDGQAWVAHSRNAVLHEIATLAGLPPGADQDSPRLLTLEAVESVFVRLAAVAEGRPAVQEGLPEHADFAAGLLILRELMHHVPLPAVVLWPLRKSQAAAAT